MWYMWCSTNSFCIKTSCRLVEAVFVLFLLLFLFFRNVIKRIFFFCSQNNAIQNNRSSNLVSDRASPRNIYLTHLRAVRLALAVHRVKAKIASRRSPWRNWIQVHHGTSQKKNCPPWRFRSHARLVRRRLVVRKVPRLRVQLRWVQAARRSTRSVTNMASRNMTRASRNVGKRSRSRLYHTYLLLHRFRFLRRRLLRPPRRGRSTTSLNLCSYPRARARLRRKVHGVPFLCVIRRYLRLRRLQNRPVVLILKISNRSWSRRIPGNCPSTKLEAGFL